MTITTTSLAVQTQDPRRLLAGIDATWEALLQSLLLDGEPVSPRGLETRELRHVTVTIDSRRPVLLNPARRLSYQFAAAEAHWILTGDDSLAGIAPWNGRMAEFSDDGQTLAGAYGPRIMRQLDGVVAKLLVDPMSRQAGLTIWAPGQGPSKDVPCTVAVWFELRRAGAPGDLPLLHTSVFMRSSDAWLGLPYDLFSFSMLAHLVAARLNQSGGLGIAPAVVPGLLSLTAASSHVYASNFEAAFSVLEAPEGDYRQALVPRSLHLSEERLLGCLRDLRDTRPGDPLRWWEQRQ